MYRAENVARVTPLRAKLFKGRQCNVAITAISAAGAHGRARHKRKSGGTSIAARQRAVVFK